MCVCLYSFFNFSLLLGVFSSIAVGYFNGVLSVLYIVILLLLCTHSHIHFSLALLLSLPYSLIFFVLLFHSEILQFVLYLLFCVVLSVSVFGVRFVERLFLWTVEFQPTNIRDGRRYKQKWKIECVYVFIAYSGVYSQKISNKNC